MYFSDIRGGIVGNDSSVEFCRDGTDVRLGTSSKICRSNSNQITTQVDVIKAHLNKSW